MEQRETVTIRPARLEDYEGVCVLENLVSSIHAQARPDYFREGQIDYSYAEFKELLAKTCPIALVAEEMGRIVGICFGFVMDYPGDAFCKPRRIALIQDISILPQCQGRGIATALLDRAKELAIQAGAVSMELRVWEFNTNARALYEKIGMRVQHSRMEMDLTGR